MFAIGREVVVPVLGEVGRVTEANYVVGADRRRRAVYIVTFPDGTDCQCSAGFLRAHDYYCDGCGGSRAGAPHARDEEAGWFCFLCAGAPARAEAERIERAEYDAMLAEVTG